MTPDLPSVVPGLPSRATRDGPSIFLITTAGESGYPGGFIDHYLLPIIYPEGLTPRLQLVLGAVVVLVNLAVYGGFLWLRRRGEQ